MNQKRLYLHSLPLMLLAIAVTIVSVASASSWRGQPAVMALLRPAVRIEPTDRGFVQVIPNRKVVDEQPGAVVDVNQTEGAVLQATQAVSSIGLQIALGQAAKK